MSTATPKEKPKELVVVSGKGGTGKTSVSAAFACLARHKVLADCDVDAPDLHLVLAPVQRDQEPFFSGLQARIAPDRCDQCGACLTHCRFGAVHVRRQAGPGDGGRPIHEIDAVACEGCGLCALVCQHGAIEMAEPQRGELLLSDTRHGPLVHARLAIGGENSGRLVSLVRERARELAEKTAAPFVLADGPPGIGCPVIASVTGADLVLVVTEPTLSALHDLRRLAQLVQGFGRPLAVCINKWDINPELTGRIETWCAERQVPVVGELDYDPAVARAQTEGKSVIGHSRNSVTRQLTDMWNVVQTMLTEA